MNRLTSGKLIRNCCNSNMKNRLIILSLFILVAGSSSFIFSNQKNTQSLFLSTNKKAIIVGEKRNSDDLSVHSYASEYAKEARAVDQAWKYIGTGNEYFRSGSYEDAVKEYKKSYSIGVRAVSGFKLAESYEKLHQYNEAIAQLNQMIKNRELSELGVQDAKEMTSRLLAAKAQADQI